VEPSAELPKDWLAPPPGIAKPTIPPLLVQWNGSSQAFAYDCRAGFWANVPFDRAPESPRSCSIERSGRPISPSPSRTVPFALVSLAVPADHGLWLNDEESASPSRPEARQGDPEGAIDGREARSWVPIDVDRELLAERELDDRLVALAPEEGEDATQNRDRERCGGRPHRGRILLMSAMRREPESRLAIGLPLVDEGERQRELTTHRRPTLARTTSWSKIASI
jgi:hypothetical protein